MALFGPKFDPGTEGVSRMNPVSPLGRRVDPAEIPGTVARRARLFGEAVELGKQGGDLRSGIASLLSREASFIKWSSLRGALMFVSMALEDPARSLDELRNAAGGNEPDGAADLIRSYESSIVNLSTYDVLRNPGLVRTDGWHLDLITWAVKAFVGAGLTGFVANIPAPQRLDVPAWYADPVFAKAERFWDGNDWSPKCRVLNGNRWGLIQNPI
jgi:hypothetical protein